MFLIYAVAVIYTCHGSQATAGGRSAYTALWRMIWGPATTATTSTASQAPSNTAVGCKERKEERNQSVSQSVNESKWKKWMSEWICEQLNEWTNGWKIACVAGVERERGSGNLGASAHEGERKGTSSLARGLAPSIPFPFPFERLPRRLDERVHEWTSQRMNEWSEWMNNLQKSKRRKLTRMF